jgi:hypothetical protein
MKNFILSILFFLFSLTSFSQSLEYARARTFNIGYRDFITNEIVWNGTTSECNILIKIQDDKVTIFSKTQQEYYVVGKLAEIDNTVQYRMQDSNGISCNFYMGQSELPGVLFIVIEYNDYAWMYLVTPELKN